MLNLNAVHFWDEYPKKINSDKGDDLLLCVYTTRSHVLRVKHHPRQNSKMASSSQYYWIEEMTPNSHDSQEDETVEVLYETTS